MPVLTINGQAIEAPPGQSIIEAARANGISIPHYCWHPGLSVAGNCRMCLVEVEKMPKLVIGCATTVADGMVVHTDSQKAKDARESVMEFLLINHPLDCPICDEAGQCKLQDYAFTHSTGRSRFEEEKQHKPKRQEVNDHIILDDERCIMCSRCVRFADEVAHQPVFTFTNRGDHVVLTVPPGETLDSPYAMNVIDLCPVGALTSRDFRFRSRVWDMSWTNTVCPGCARGCNIEVGARDNHILRVDPRVNPRVNTWWICDDGRLNGWSHVERADRLDRPRVRRSGELMEVEWSEAIAEAYAVLSNGGVGRIGIVGSPYATNEDNCAAKELASVFGTEHVFLADHLFGEDDSLLIRADKTPNALGARLALYGNPSTGANIASLAARIASREVRALLVMDEDLFAIPALASVLTLLDGLVVCSPVMHATAQRANVVLSASTFAEVEGTFTNFAGMVQMIRPAIATTENMGRLGMNQSRLDRFGTKFDRWAQGTKRHALPQWRILQSIARARGAKQRDDDVSQVFDRLASRVPQFKGLSYELIDERNGCFLAGMPATPTTVPTMR
jgi:NADH-quinone oxidoreductase subunit G